MEKQQQQKLSTVRAGGELRTKSFVTYDNRQVVDLGEFRILWIVVFLAAGNALVREAFTELWLAELLTDLDRRQSNEANNQRRDFEQCIRSANNNKANISISHSRKKPRHLETSVISI